MHHVAIMFILIGNDFQWTLPFKPMENGPVHKRFHSKLHEGWISLDFPSEHGRLLNVVEENYATFSADSDAGSQLPALAGGSSKRHPLGAMIGFRHFSGKN